MSRPAATLALAALLPGVAPLAAQTTFGGYYQNVPLWTGQTVLAPSAFSDFNRLRLTLDSDFGNFSFVAAYEQLATFREHRSPGFSVGIVPGGSEWLDLQWTITDEEHLLWQHRFDRLQLGWTPASWLELSAGRQAVSWATTLFLTPADPFSPFDPADPFRQFRAGVDAARVRIYPSALSEIDLVVRPTDNESVGEELTVLGRGLTTWKGWELSTWAGSLYGDLSFALGGAGAIGGTAVRFEGVVRENEAGDGAILRTTLGFDRRFAPAGRDLFVIFEYQRDELGATSPDEYIGVLTSSPFARGELQVLGRDEIALQASYQLHPLWSLTALGLWNLNDGSVLLSPSVAYSASDEIALSGGLFFGFGDDQPTLERPLPSEYGLTGTTAYASFSIFF